jgi:transposase
MKCRNCGRKIKSFTKRNDWSHRQLHLTCWIELQSQIPLKSTTFEETLDMIDIFKQLH